eukprot:g22586.t1
MSLLQEMQLEQLHPVILDSRPVLVADEAAAGAGSAGHELRLSGLIAVFKPSGVSTEEILGPLPVAAVSRLDKPTSGVLVAALGDESAFHLASAQFAAQSVKKEYICLCHGFLGPPGGQGRTKQALRRSSRGPMEVAKGDGQDAETEVLEVFKGPYTLLKVIPKTGRRHQLRVHLASMGRPIVGDLLYGSAPWFDRSASNPCGFSSDPGSGERLRSLPPLPVRGLARCCRRGLRRGSAVACRALQDPGGVELEAQDLIAADVGHGYVSRLWQAEKPLTVLSDDVQPWIFHVPLQAVRRMELKMPTPSSPSRRSESKCRTGHAEATEDRPVIIQLVHRRVRTVKRYFYNPYKAELFSSPVALQLPNRCPGWRLYASAWLAPFASQASCFVLRAMAVFANTSITIKVLEPRQGEKPAEGGDYYWGMVDKAAPKDM